MSLWIIALIAVGFGILVLIALWVVVARVARKAKERWLMENAGTEVVMSANGPNCAAFPGENFKLRGNGLLVLTPDYLDFIMWAPEKSLRIPIKNILTADTVKSFAGRWGRLPMLHIVFMSETGGMLETAWSMAGAKSWVEEIKKIKKIG